MEDMATSKSVRRKGGYGVEVSPDAAVYTLSNAACVVLSVFESCSLLGSPSSENVTLGSLTV